MNHEPSKSFAILKHVSFPAQKMNFETSPESYSIWTIKGSCIRHVLSIIWSKKSPIYNFFNILNQLHFIFKHFIQMQILLWFLYSTECYCFRRRLWQGLVEIHRLKYCHLTDWQLIDKNLTFKWENIIGVNSDARRMKRNCMVMNIGGGHLYMLFSSR